MNNAEKRIMDMLDAEDRATFEKYKSFWLKCPVLIGALIEPRAAILMSNRRRYVATIGSLLDGSREMRWIHGCSEWQAVLKPDGDGDLPCQDHLLASLLWFRHAGPEMTKYGRYLKLGEEYLGTHADFNYWLAARNHAPQPPREYFGLAPLK